MASPIAFSRSQVKLTKKRLKKYFVSDFEDSSWTLGIQWKSKPYEVFTTKVRGLSAKNSQIHGMLVVSLGVQTNTKLTR